jgi:AsmA protein
MNTIFKKYGLKCIKYFSFTILIVLTVLLITPLFFKQTLLKQTKILLKEYVEANVDFKDVSVSFFTDFPALTVSMHEVQVHNTEKFQSHKFLEANQLAVGVNVLSLFSETIVFDEIYIDKANISVVIDSLGNANYNIFKSAATVAEAPEDEEAFNLKIQKIKILESNILYVDQFNPMRLQIENLNYTGKGNLYDDIFQLDSYIKLQALDFTMDGIDYVKNKSIRANILTTVDANKLKFTFDKNSIAINRFRFAFSGDFAFVKNGYNMNLNLKSEHSKLSELLSLIPSNYQSWLADTKIYGDITFQATASGAYTTTQKPVVTAFLQIDKASIANKNFEKPIENLKLLAFAELEDLDIEKLRLDLKYFDFELNNQPTHFELQSKGLQTVWVNTTLNSQLNLADFQQAIGIDQFDLKGNLAINFSANGTYKTTPVRYGAYLDTVISSIPVFDLKANLTQGYFKHATLDKAINKVEVKAHMFAKDSLLQNASFLIDNINIQALSNFIKGKVRIDNFVNYHMDTNLESKINLAEISQFYPIDSVVLKGNLDAKFVAKGVFDLDKKLFPATRSTLKLKNGYIKSLAFPDLPIEDIQVETRVTSPLGKFNDLQIEVLPIHFTLAGAPFRLDANLYNLEDLNYSINSKGILNIGNLYKIFKIDGLNVDGIIKTNLSLKGITSDAVTGKYEKLQNKGSLEVQNIAILTRLFPKYFYINDGKFFFHKDKMLFKEFTAQYGNSSLNLNGQLDNVLHYVMANQREINGDFILSSNYVDADELMAYTPSSENDITTQSEAGVILIPKQVNLAINAQVDKIKFNTLNIEKFSGVLNTNEQKLTIPKANFVLAGTKVALKAAYQPTSTTSANFESTINASNFDIQKAYNEIPMMQELVSMAKDAYGTMSLNYQLSGRLDKNMEVVYPSLKGKGTLTLENIKFKNFKLLNTVSQKADASSIKTANFNKIDLKTTIANNVLNIEKTKFKMAGFRGRLQGQTTLDGKMNIGFRLGLPPFGIFGIPMKISGTSDNFKVSIGRFKINEALEEEDPESSELISINK